MSLTACKSRPGGDNPLLTTWDTPYGVPPFDKIEARHFEPAYEAAMKEHLTQIDAIKAEKAAPSFENTMLAYDRAGVLLERVDLVFSMLCSAEKTDEMAALQAKMSPLLAAHRDKILMDADLFARIKAVYEKRDALDAEQKRLVERTYKEFVRAGAQLDPEQKERLKQINAELAATAVAYGNNLLAETNGFQLEVDSLQLAGLPEGVKNAARKDGKFILTMDTPTRLAVLTYSTVRPLREQIYKGYTERGNHGNANDNKAAVADFARLRNEKAHLLGYTDYATYVISDQMAGKPEAVNEMLDGLFRPALEGAKAELAKMEPLLHADIPGAQFEAWDWWFYAEKLRKQQYDLDEEAVKPYFSLENTRTGAFLLANRLYGITFRPISVPVYHKDVTAYEVLDADNSHIGVLYFDFHPRAGKSAGAWCGNYVQQRYEADGTKVSPVVSIVCNFTRPADENTPALFTIDEVETLFHEFGHALHFLFADVKYRGLTWPEGDFIELPSQLMENWVREPELLKQWALHYRSGEPIPTHLIEKMRNASKFNQGFMLTELTAAAIIDQQIHGIKEYQPLDVNAFEKAATDRLGLIRQIAPRYRYPYFSHIFDGGYSAGYYFYLWAEVLDQDAFQAFKQSGDVFNKQLAHDFRFKLLARGGSADGMTLYRDFRGADPDKRAMLIGRGLIEEPVVEPADDGVGEQPAQ